MKKELKFISNLFNIDYKKHSRGNIEKCLKNKLDWEYISRTIISLDVGPLAYRYVSMIKNNNIPEWFIKKLGECYNSAIIKNMLVWNGLDDIKNIFCPGDIEILLLKGVFMCDVVYKNIESRHMIDIDILVKEKDLKKTDILMQKNNYLKIKEYPGQIVYKKIDANQPTVEIHYNAGLSSDFPVPTGFLWENRLATNNDCTCISYPSLENAVIYSALHFFHHFSEALLYDLPALPPLKSVLDIHDIISKNQDKLDWGYITETAKRYKIKYVLYLSIMLSKIYFRTPIPFRFLNSIRVPFIRYMLLQRFLHRYIDMQGRRYSSLSNIKYIYYIMLEKIIFLEKIWCPIDKFAERHNLPYPSIKTFLCYALRPLYWLKKLFDLDLHRHDN